MALYSGYPVDRGPGGGCCSSLGRVTLMFITVLSTTFTIGTLIVAGSALYDAYKTSRGTSTEPGDLLRLWLVVAAGCVAVATNVCGFVGALLRVRCLLLGYALVTALAVGGHLLMTQLKRRATDTRPQLTQLGLDDHPQSVWTAEMNAHTAQVLQRVGGTPEDPSALTAARVNRTVSELRARLAPNASGVAESALRTVNTVQSLFRCCGKDGVDEYIARNVSIPESCCADAARCNATLRRRPGLNPARARRLAHRRPCGPLLEAARSLLEAAAAWLGLVAAGSQLCGVVTALLLACCCL